MSGMEPLMFLGSGTAAVGGTVLQAEGHRMRGREEALAAEFEQDQLKIQEQTTRTAAMQAEAERRREFTSSLETIEAIRAGRGVGQASPTGEAIMAGATEDAERDMRIERVNFLQKADLSRRAAVMAGRKAKMSLLAGNMAAAGAYIEGGQKLAKMSMGR